MAQCRQDAEEARELGGPGALEPRHRRDSDAGLVSQLLLGPAPSQAGLPDPAPDEIGRVAWRQQEMIEQLETYIRG